MREITVVGSYNVGLTIKVERLPRKGETVSGSDFTETPGGKGSNQAIAARRLGAEVSIVACIGRDKYGENALSLWEKEKVRHEFVKYSKLHTGLGFVVVSSEGENMIVVDPGANMELMPEDVRGASELIESSSVLLLQLEIPLETALEAARIAKKKDVTVILNPAPARELREILSFVDVLTPNETEFEEITGTRELSEGCERLTRKGTRAVIVTLAERGCFFYTKGRKGYYSTPRVKALDPTGAGDAFNGALAVALSEGKQWDDAITFANFAGAFSVTRKEVVPSLPRRDELEYFMRRKMRYTRSPLSSL